MNPLRQIANLFDEHLSLPELHQLAFRLGMDVDNLRGEVKSEKIEDFVRKTGHRWPEVVTAVAGINPSLAQQLAEIEPIPPLAVNPFGLKGKLENPDHFCPRVSFMAELSHELAKGSSVSLIGASQSGKSSLLWQLAQNRPTRFSRAVYLSLELFRDDAEFFSEVCQELEACAAFGFCFAPGVAGATSLALPRRNGKARRARFFAGYSPEQGQACLDALLQHDVIRPFGSGDDLAYDLTVPLLRYWLQEVKRDLP